MSYAVAVSNINTPRLGPPDCSEGVTDRHITEITVPCKDRFVPYEDENESQYEENSNASWLGSIKRFFGRIVDIARRWWREIRRHNPLSWLFNFIERERCREHIQQAQSRNGARNEEELTEYHRSLERNGIFRIHLGEGNSPRPLVVLFLGNSQTLDTERNVAGVNELYHRLSQNPNIDVAIFRVGTAGNDLSSRFLFGDCSLNTDVVFEHTSSVLEDLINGRGLFRGRQQPTRIVLSGYSFGGGTINRLLNEQWERIGQNIPVSAALIDPITLGADDCGHPVEYRPPHVERYCLFYQQNSSAINGCSQYGLRDGDICREVHFDDHESIDNNPFVLRQIMNFINSEVSR